MAPDDETQGPDEGEWFEALSRDFARHSRERRITMRLSQKLVAQTMKWYFGPRWHQTIVAKIENGQRAVRMDEALALCRIYGMELDDLLAGRNMDVIRNAYTVSVEDEATVYVEHNWAMDPDAEQVSISELLKRGEASLKSETTREIMQLAERLKREYPDDEEARVRAWQEARRVSRGEHQEEG